MTDSKKKAGSSKGKAKSKASSKSKATDKAKSADDADKKAEVSDDAKDETKKSDGKAKSGDKAKAKSGDKAKAKSSDKAKAKSADGGGDKAKAKAAAHGDDEHHGPSYVKIWGILVVLLIASVCGPMLEIQVVTLVTAFGIAFVKAFLVAKHFMHLNVEKRYISYLMFTAIAFMVLFYAGVSPDVQHHDGQRWSNDAAKAEVKRAMKAQAAQAAHGHAH